MVTRYIELRKTAARGTDSIAADVMRHLHTRQHIGKAVIITAQPVPLLAASRKQWLKLTRTLQKQRASTLNADKILKHTHTITHMQHMQFTARGPLEAPEAEVYFMAPGELGVIPVHCWSVYVLDHINGNEVDTTLAQLPAEALIIDYTHHLQWVQDFGLRPKDALEAQVDTEWRQVEGFMTTHGIDIIALADEETHNVDAMDTALDTLLGVSHKFMQIANEFQRTLELARPVRVGKPLRARYDVLMLLAHRVQALSPGAFTQQFLQTYNEDDTFFLYDPARELRAAELQTLYAYHMTAGRTHLAKALQLFYSQRPGSSRYATMPAGS